MDAATRQHDIRYTYIEKNFTGTSAEAVALRNQACFVADMEMLENVVRYQPRVSGIFGDTTDIPWQ